LFIDEIHRFNKASRTRSAKGGGNLILSARRENPFFGVNKALFSRSTVLPLQPLTELKSADSRPGHGNNRGLELLYPVWMTSLVILSISQWRRQNRAERAELAVIHTSPGMTAASD
jgi:replication-associated recombination protein RarA